MKKTSTILQRILTLVFVLLIVWYIAYFFWGEQTSVYFTDRVFASYFPHILVFSTAVSIYGLFVLLIRSQRKKWMNFLFFFLGLMFSSLPLLAYHGYFQYQDGFWNQKIENSKTLYINKLKNDESVKEFQFRNEINQEIKWDTVFSKAFTPYFELNQQVEIKVSEKGNWTVSD